MTDLAAIKAELRALLEKALAVQQHPESEPDTNEWWDKVNDLCDAARDFPTARYRALLAATPSVEPDERGLLPGEPDPREPSCAYPGCGLPEFVHGKSGHPFRALRPSVEPHQSGAFGTRCVTCGADWDVRNDRCTAGPRPSVEPLNVERLARALSFAHPGPWPGKLSSAEFARVVAGAYEHGYEAGKLPCTFHRPYDDSMCGRTEDDPIHPDPDDRMGSGRHVYRHDPVEYDRLLPTQASDSPEKPT